MIDESLEVISQHKQQITRLNTIIVEQREELKQFEFEKLKAIDQYKERIQMLNDQIRENNYENKELTQESASFA